MLQLPLRGPRASNLVDIDCEGAYSLFGRIGLEYSDVFRRIKTSSRRLGHATASAVWDEGSLSDHYIVHPAILDVAFQSMFIARAHPNSGQISSALLPSRIEHVTVVPSSSLLSKLQRRQTISAEFDSWVLNQTATSVRGDINVYDSDTGSPLLQVEGFEVKMVGELDASNHRLLFSKTSWGPDVSLLGLADPIRNAAADAAVLSSAEASERVSLFYVRQIMDEISIQDRSDAMWYHKRMLESFDQHLEKVKNDQHLHLRTEWLSDDWTVIQALGDANPDAVELQMLHAVGKNMLSVIRGEKHMLEVMRVNNLLDRFYADDKGMQQVNYFSANAIQQIIFKFPCCRILEIGAGTGATIK
ncbi:putative secondary metabolism biosynthetic enzyme [Metarhizium acridum]|nr:putative secondary metabolism biosynthetic enzyme [Metarhizium acridum]